MRKFLRILRRITLALLVLVLSAAAILYFLSEREIRKRYQFAPDQLTVPTDVASIERGRVLVENQFLCAECHGKDYGGKVFIDGGAVVARLTAPNLTRGEGGIGSRYTDADWVRTLRHAVAPDGRPLLVMPSQHYTKVTASDLGSAIAYLKSLPPVNRQDNSRYLGPMGRVLILANTHEIVPASGIDHAQPPPSVVPADLVQRGEYLANTSGCTGCHKPDLTGGAGPPPGSGNITPVGVGHWREEDFVRTLRTGHTPDGRQLSESMPRVLGNMSDEELHALWAYLRTVPAKGERTARQQAGPTPATARSN